MAIDREIGVKEIIVQIGKREEKLTLAEARKLKSSLDSLFNDYPHYCYWWHGGISAPNQIITDGPYTFGPYTISGSAYL